MKIKVAIFFLIIFSILVSFLNIDKSYRIESYINEHNNYIRVLYKISYEKYKQIANEIFYNHINKPQIISLFETVNKNNKDQIRKKLEDMLNPFYKNIQKQNIRQLHFHLPNNHSFLRFHRPDKYGDDLTDIRKTVAFVNQNIKPIDTFEEGRIFNGFRFVFPISSKDDKHLASVEVSVSPLAFIESIVGNIDNIKVDFLINKYLVDKKVFEDEKNTNYTISGFSKDFYIDNAVTNLNRSFDTLKIVQENLTQDEKRDIVDALKREKLYNKIIHHKDSRSVVLTFLPILNSVTNENGAYMVFAYDSLYLTNGIAAYRYTLFLIFLFCSVLSYFFYSYIKIKNKTITMLNHEQKLKQDYKKQYLLHKKAQKIAKIGHWELDHKTKIFNWSDEIYNIFNLDIKDIGSDISYDFYKSIIEQSDTKKVEELFEYSIENHTPFEIVHKIIDQKTKQIRYIKQICHHEYDENDDIKYSIGTAQDITIIVKNEKEREKLNSIIEQLPISVVITDKSGMIEYANPYFSKVTGYTKDEVYHKNPNILKSGFTTNDHYKNMWDSITLDKKVFETEFKNIKKDGSEYFERAIIFPLLDENKNIINLIGIKQDITKYKELTKELKEKQNLLILNSHQKAMSQILSNIAHHWRQPLNIISTALINIETMIAFGESLDDKKEDIGKFINVSSEQVQYLSKTIDDFSTNFHENSDTIEVLQVKDILESVLDIYKIQLEKIELKKELDIVSPIYANKGEMVSVIGNIIDNSCYFLNLKESDDKMISIKLTEEDEKIYIVIIDNGGGINEKYIDKIYDPYFSTKVHKNQTGLGLYIAKSIINKLDGSIDIENYKDGLKVVLSFKKD